MASTIVLTGATSGFGAAALEQITKETDHRVIVGARNPVAVDVKYGDRVTALPLDLSSLSSVRAFCAELPVSSIDVLGMNAGMQTRKLKLTEDGFEATFQVNYLSHFLVFDLLRPRLSKTAIVVTTGSGTHDPEEKTPVPSPQHGNVNWMAHPDKNPNPDKFTPKAVARAYSTSKLFCVMMAREIAARYPSLQAVSFDPGYLPDTNLTREYPKFLSKIVKKIIPYTMKNDRSGTVATTAPEYTRVLLGDLTPDQNGGYIVMRNAQPMEVPASALALSPGTSDTMWTDSLKLLKEARN